MEKMGPQGRLIKIPFGIEGPVHRFTLKESTVYTYPILVVFRYMYNTRIACRQVFIKYIRNIGIFVGT